MKEIILGAGCFWGTQAFFDKIKGVEKTDVGYANGLLDEVTYEEVCKGNTEFIEVCKITFDENIISLEKILEKFFKIIDPTLVNQQGNDFGTQYQSAIFFHQSDEQSFKNIINNFIEKMQINYKNKIETKVDYLKNYISAEEYHQKYLEKNPYGYCHINLDLADD
ncbi:peptide-methionine (S)-S-oxide reductase MsrA [Spiroplasma turonicum]|uniref:Peptide methionine sulfoxide reductase MsrA n=1 Tax=Spiroplasma turonicum TaxID=216946 RepID=A0A0K1P5H9_9MOLU|nr:peptide-methionine (S)-S-oxide reductase MsrA [Spiroplasma turonicum]AKU79434.1 peptide methionine sulfoxide reductase MsrA/MsrB [Spiroplasma turonicum]ALX70455.1 peptide methionine sulfoxide reductase MsrA/MsrB [Spiroplasma turonicum]